MGHRRTWAVHSLQQQICPQGIKAVLGLASRHTTQCLPSSPSSFGTDSVCGDDSGAKKHVGILSLENDYTLCCVRNRRVDGFLPSLLHLGGSSSSSATNSSVVGVSRTFPRK